MAIVMLPPLSAAAASSNITTSPITADLSVHPGQTETTTLQVENNGSAPVSIAVQLKEFRPVGTDGQAQIYNPEPSDPAPSWVHFSQMTLTAQPGVWTPLQMTISLPTDADLGYYYAVLFKPILPANTSRNSNTITLSNAILVLVDTGSGNEIRSLQVTSFTASKHVYEYLPVSFNVTVRNNGNIYLPPEGLIYISRSPNSTNVIDTVNLNSSGGRVLPSSSRTFTASWSDGFPVFQPVTLAGQPVTKKNGQPVEHLQWNFANTNHLRFGKYYAKLTLIYSNGQRDIPIYATLSFWVIPWKLIIIIILLILIPVGLLVLALRYRRLYRKAQKPVKQEKT